MPPVPAHKGDTLCGIAIAHGFPHCGPLRAEAANGDFLNRPLREGDQVTIPERQARQDQGAAQAIHIFEALSTPPPGIRFVHGSPNEAFQADATFRYLNVSNYITNKAGQNGTENMPTTYGFNEHADKDPDTFKIEVVDPGARSNTVDVTLESLKPIYAANGRVTGHQSFADADPDAAMRKNITVTCDKVSPANRVRFRSRYMRLVVDEQDFNALSANHQTLLTTDMADGNNGANDRIEILDQKVRASYTLIACPAPAGHKCTISEELPFQNIRRRIRLCVHVFKETVGGTNAAGITEQNIRLRTMKWFRRAYAQVSMAPKFVPCSSANPAGPAIEFIDPPPDNMITISQEHGTPVSAAGGPYSITFRLGLPPGGVAAAEAAAVAMGLTAADARPNVTINLTNGWTPEQVADAIVTTVGALRGAIFSAQSFRNARGFTAVNRSYDILITRTDSRRVMIENENRTAGAGITIDVARVDTTNVTGAIPPSLPVLNPNLRHLIRDASGTDDRIDIYICRDFEQFGGLALIPHSDLAADYQPESPMQWACFVMAGALDSSNPGDKVMDGSDNYPWVYPHEVGHILPDAFHIDAACLLSHNCLMDRDVLPQQHPVDATKRIFDSPVLVQYGFWDPAQPTVGASKTDAISMARRFRDKSGQVTEAW